jgi:hypothetical protein
MIYSAQAVHVPCVKISTYLQTDRSELPLEPRHLGVPSGASKTISKPMECSAQIVHLSSIKIVSIPKRNEIRLYMTHHLVVPSCASKMISEPMVCLVQTVHLFSFKWNEIRFYMTHVT